jgi:hypothetical protein
LDEMETTVVMGHEGAKLRRIDMFRIEDLGDL